MQVFDLFFYEAHNKSKKTKKHDGVVYVKKKQYLCKTKIIVYAEIQGMYDYHGM